MLFQLLQDALRELGLPLTRDGTFLGGAPAAAMCICVLGSPLPYLSLLLEAGTVSPGDALLCLSPTWLSCCPSPPSTLLLVHRAVSFDLGGRTQLLTFDPPRQVTYFLPCAPWAEQIQEVTRELDCPMGGSADLFQFWGDTLNARIALQRGGLCCPPTLAVVLSPLTDKLNYGGDEAGVCIVEVTDFMKEEEEERVRKAVQSFLESAVVQRSGKVVLKSSRAQWPGRAGIPVRFLDQKNLEAVWAGLCSLLPLLEKGEAALLEAYCPTLTRNHLCVSDANIPAPELSMKICAIVTRSPQDVPLLYKLVCRVGVSDSPLSHRDSLPQSLNTALREWGFSDPSFCLSVHRLLSQTAQRCLRVVMDTEAGLSPDQRGGIAAQTDLIGVDMLLCLSNGSAELTPVVLGLHSWQCLQSCALGTAAMTGKEERGEAESPGSLLHTPLTRSQRHLLRGKSVLVIGAGRISKKFVWESARDYGLKIFLVESDPSHFAAGLVSRFLAMDVTDHQQDEEHCARICAWLSQNDLQPDGCLCFWDDCIVLASLICQHLGLRGPPPEAVQTSKEKSRTHLHLLGLSSSSQDLFPSPRIYAVPCAHVESAADIQKVVTDGEIGDGSIKLRFPAIMKLEYGAGAVGVKRVDSLSESLAHLEKIAGDLREETDYPGIGLGWGNAMTLMEYIGGTEHDVDVVIFDGRLEGAFVSDNGPTRVPGFTETAAQMPTGLPRDKEAQLIEAAYRCCLGCGLRDGVFNVEMKMTPSGPKLIEINARMGGFYLRDWIREIFGVDILFCAFLIACGLAPRLPPQRLPALCHLTGVMCVVSQHLHALRTTASPPVLRELHRRGVLRLCEMEEELIAGEYEEPYCNVGVRAERPQDARLSLLTLSQALGIDSPHYPVSYFLSHFK
uniref:ATP-grasp domain-containing protein n=1 Tax=Lepisosteus oculatus TaxID=7918 RepID=W5LX94_LEPOC